VALISMAGVIKSWAVMECTTAFSDIKWMLKFLRKRIDMMLRILYTVKAPPMKRQSQRSMGA